MKFLCLGDLHATDRAPKVRRDADYFLTFMKKFIYCLKLAKDKECDAILQPGDFTDTHKPSNRVLRTLIETIRASDAPPIYAVFGQHDMRFHSADRENTALSVLQAAGCVKILNSPGYIKPGVWVSPVSYGDPIPEYDPSITGYKIMLIHAMIIVEKLWEDQKDFYHAPSFLREQPYDLIVSGDNHQTFTAGKPNGKLLINSGSIMRSNITQIAHKPSVHLVDTLKSGPKRFIIPCDDVSEIMNLEEVLDEKTRTEELDKFIDVIREERDKDPTLDFMSKVEEVLGRLSGEEHTAVEEYVRRAIDDAGRNQ